MKQPTKSLSDVDLRGRVRREPGICDATQPVTVKLLDGPMAGREIVAQRGADYIKIGPWLYSYAGKEGMMRVYCRVPTKRIEKRILRFMIAKRGSDPRVDMARARPKPILSNAPTKRGQGARRREAERKLRAGQTAWAASDGYNGT